MSKNSANILTTYDCIINNFWSFFNLISNLASEELISVVIFSSQYLCFYNTWQRYMSVFGFKVKANFTLSSSV